MINGKKPPMPFRDELDDIPEHIREEALKLTQMSEEWKEAIALGVPIILGTGGEMENHVWFGSPEQAEEFSKILKDHIKHEKKRED